MGALVSHYHSQNPQIQQKLLFTLFKNIKLYRRMQPLVSVIMPAFNAEKYIAQSIDSVLSQTFQDWELIVVDDGSTDKTAKLIRKFADLDQRVKYLFQQNSGQGRARNIGVKNSSGCLVAFLDSDDLWLEKKLSLQTEAIKQMEADLVFTDGFIFQEDHFKDETTPFSTITGKFSGREMFGLLFTQNRIPILSVLMRRKILIDVGLFEEDLKYHGAEDYDLWLRVAKHGAIFYGMEERLVRYRCHALSTSRAEIKMIRAWQAVLTKYSHDSSLEQRVKQNRYKGLNQDLVGAYIRGKKITKAMYYIGKLPMWDGLKFALLLLTWRAKSRSETVKTLLMRCYHSGIYRTKCGLRLLGLNLK